MKTSAIGLAIASALLSTLALAGEPTAATPMQHTMPMQHSMPMTPEQHQKKMDGMFDDIDANHDGSITRAEFKAHQDKMMAMHRQMGMGHDMMKPGPAAKPDEHKHQE